MIDTHCHLNFNTYKDDKESVIKRAGEAGLSAMINVGSQWDTSVRAVELAESYPNLYAAVGLHPVHLFEQEIDEEESHFTTRAEVFNFKKYFDLAKSSDRVVAIGECGLDYFWWPKDKTQDEVKTMQAELFSQQLDLAVELGLPVISHCREAYADLLSVIKKHSQKGQIIKGVSHCFLGNRQEAKEFLDLGFMLSFTGIITFKNVDPELLEVIKETPIEKIMVETDSPYLAPHPYRGKRNEPAMVVEVARKIAELKGLSLNEVDEITTNNAKSFFKI